MKKKKLGEVLQERGHISAADLAQLVAEQQGKVIRLGELMLHRSLVSKQDLSSALEEVTHVPYIDCTAASPDPEVLPLISREMAIRCCVFPIARDGKKLIVAMAEPQNLGLSDELKFKTGATISPRLGFRGEIFEAIGKYYGGKVPWEDTETSGTPIMVEDAAPVPQMEFISTSTRQANKDAIKEAQAELIRKHTPAVRLVSQVIIAAREKNASDIHIEPQVGDLVVRIRVDGVLRDLQHVPRAIQNSFVSRVKILADMDIAERRNPQDGRFLVRLGTTSIDMRVSSLPTQYGEKIVLRLLETSSVLRGFTELGLPAEVTTTLTDLLSMPQGMILVTGPTGSGKSTTLYAALEFLRKPAVNIVTVEDPVEYVLPGINQVHMNTKTGLTFASCLRSILRQDPNVIMVGEIRDRETAEISMKAAQTGHLVLSTMHTNDAVSAITRLLDLDIPAYMIASSVTGIVAQRLVRRLCECHKEVETSSESADRLAALGMTQTVETVCVAVGCEKCDQTGYRGRIGIYEILVFDETVREAIRTGERNDQIRNHMRHMGMRLMQEDALEKILSGMTSVEEIARVVPVHTDTFVECSSCTRKMTPTFQFCPHCGTKRSKSKSRSDARTANSPLEGIMKS